MAFQSWTALYTKMLDIFASGDPSVKSASYGDKNIQWADWEEFKSKLEYVKGMSLAEQNNQNAPARRVYAKNGGM